MMFMNLLVLTAVVAARPLLKRDVTRVPGFDYENDKVRGVNLGGWFVLEPYMNPSFFNQGFDSSDLPVDEYHLTQKWGKERSQSALSHHWDTWIQESDFANLEQWGLNFVRIPIGYWAFLAREEDPYVQGQIPYLDRALTWAKQHHIQVWIDLHGVPGSQNGFDNSGLRDSYEWQNPAYQNQQQTIEVLQTISDRYGGPDYYDTVIGIELVNEPLGVKLDLKKLEKFYEDGYNAVREKGEQGVIIHDAYEPLNLMTSWLQTPDFYNVVEDHHYYQVFSVAELNRTIDEHVQFACNTGKQIKSIDNKWHVVGEWSAALTDCTPLLHGVYIGALYDGSAKSLFGAPPNTNPPLGSCDWINDITQWSDEHKQNTRRFVEAQLDAWEYSSSGWIIWAYKTENSIEWDLGRLVEHGLFPVPPTERQYPNQCDF